MDPPPPLPPPAALSFPMAAPAFATADGTFLTADPIFPTPQPSFPADTSAPAIPVPPITTLPPVNLSHPTNSRHPPYAQMITEAIESLKERNGSSKQAIAKYIEQTFSNLPPTHSALLGHHLKRLKDSGQLAMVKHSYKLRRSAPQVFANGPKRRPGRPPKSNLPIVPLPPPQQGGVNVSNGPQPFSVPESVFVSLGLSDGPVSPAKRRPGRPRKSVDVGGGVSVPRPRGRPKRNVSGVVGMPTGQPSGDVGAPTAVDGVDTGGDVAVPVASAGEMQARRGGNPQNQPMRPRGRPKKNTSSAVAQPSSLQQVLAYLELKSRFEFIQRRIKQSVDTIKPFLNNQTAGMHAALQELEELATLDFTATSSSQGQGQQPPPTQTS